MQYVILVHVSVQYIEQLFTNASFTKTRLKGRAIAKCSSYVAWNINEIFEAYTAAPAAGKSKNCTIVNPNLKYWWIKIKYWKSIRCRFGSHFDNSETIGQKTLRSYLSVLGRKISHNITYNLRPASRLYTEWVNLKLNISSQKKAPSIGPDDSKTPIVFLVSKGKADNTRALHVHVLYFVLHRLLELWVLLLVRTSTTFTFWLIGNSFCP